MESLDGHAMGEVAIQMQQVSVRLGGMLGGYMRQEAQSLVPSSRMVLSEVCSADQALTVDNGCHWKIS